MGTYMAHLENPAAVGNVQPLGRIVVVDESTGEPAAVALHSRPGFDAGAFDRALESAGWRRSGDWRYELLCRVEPVTT